jgi:hypothetical protein
MGKHAIVGQKIEATIKDKAIYDLLSEEIKM